MTRSKLRIVMFCILLAVIATMVGYFYTLPPDVRNGFLLGFSIPFILIFKILTSSPYLIALTILAILASVVSFLYRRSK